MDEISKNIHENKKDCREWNPLIALEELVFDIKAGKVKPKSMIIHFLEDSGGKSPKHYYQAIGLSYADHIAILNFALKRVLDEWMVND